LIRLFKIYGTEKVCFRSLSEIESSLELESANVFLIIEGELK
jgi:hypothetical protein